MSEKTDKYDEDILTGNICPYCGAKTIYVSSKEIYGRCYGMIYLCRPCRAYVGVHKGTKCALGRLANEELRNWKKRAHFYFDNLWRQKRRGNGRRKKAYRWLAKKLDIPEKYAHIGMFDVETCKKSVSICKPYFKHFEVDHKRGGILK